MARAAKVTKAEKSDEVVDGATGEVISENHLTTVDPNDSDVLAMLKSALTTKEDDFEESIDDFWKPQDEKRKDSHELRGVYLGYTRSGKLYQHAVGTAHPTRKGELFVKRFNGTAILNKLLANGPKDVKAPGVFIKYNSTGKTMDGQKLHDFTVRWLTK